MRKPLTQLPIDFGGEESKPSPPREGSASATQQEGQFLAAPGVGIRVKAFKKPSTASASANGDLFQVLPGGETTPGASDQRSPEAGQVDAPAVQPETGSVMAGAITKPEPAASLRAPAPSAAKPGRKAGPSKRGRKSLKQATAEADLIEIPADEVLFSKQYYTMGEVSEMFRVNQSLLRYWETEFDILQPRKN
ncbi:MAG TPA: MerR family transcriptional regulator, partial [Puia sp.]|nr:MerR family transcriptional regulator [Puia sp.]